MPSQQEHRRLLPLVQPWAPFSSFHLWVQIPIYEQELEQCFTAMVAPGNHHRRCRLSLEEVPPHVDMSADNRASRAWTRLKDQLSHLSRQPSQPGPDPVLAVSKHMAPYLPSLAQLFPRTPPEIFLDAVFLSRRKDEPTEITLTLNLIAYQASESNTDGMRVIFLLGEMHYYYIASVSDIWDV